MNAVLIPFFLGVNVAVEEPWPYGPEYTFELRVNASAFPQIRNEVRANVEMHSKLVCQPKGLEKLSCRFDQTKSQLFLLNDRVPEIPLEQVYYMEDYTVDQTPFELIFDERGLDAIVANGNIHKRQLDIVRSVVHQLNFGSNLRDKLQLKFRTKENFANGECESDFEIERKQNLRPDKSNRSFEITPRFLTIEQNEIVEIVRTRDLEACAEHFPYYFGSCAACHLNEDALVEVKASENRMTISANEFTSSTSSIIRMSSKSDPTRWNRLCEEISLRVESVEPAAALPPNVQSPITADIFPTKWFITNTPVQ